MSAGLLAALMAHGAVASTLGEPGHAAGIDNRELANLIEEAESRSPDLLAAVARVRQAEASARVAGAVRGPELSASLEASREGRLGGQASVDGTGLAAGLVARYEVDVWGRLRAGEAAALQRVSASEFDQRALRLTVSAAIATAWIQAIDRRERAQIAERQLQSAERLLTLVEARGRAGAALALEVAQQRGLVASQRRAFLTLRQEAAQAEITLGLLVGRDLPLSPMTASLAPVRPTARDAPVDGLMERLAQRPDVAAAEARLQAADADVSAARAALKPAFTLEAGAGWSSERLGQLLSNPVYALAGNLVAPLFNGGRLKAQQALTQAQRDELAAAYRQSLLAAVADLRDVVVVAEGLDAQAEAQTEVMTQAQRAVTLAEARYRAGAQSLMDLLDAQRSLFTALDETAALQAKRLETAVGMYRALGGGG